MDFKSRLSSQLLLSIFSINLLTIDATFSSALLDPPQYVAPLPTIENPHVTDLYQPFSQYPETTNFLYSDDLITKMLKDPIPRPSISPTPKPKLQVKKKPHSIVAISPTAHDALFEKYGQQYNISPQILKLIAKCESTFNPKAVSGPYAGLFQFHTPTWQSNRRAMGLDANPDLRFDAEESVKTAAFKMSRDGFGAWPVCGARAIQTASLQ